MRVKALCAVEAEASGHVFSQFWHAPEASVASGIQVLVSG